MEKRAGEVLVGRDCKEESVSRGSLELEVLQRFLMLLHQWPVSLRDCLCPLQVMGELLHRQCVQCPQKEQHLHIGRQISPSIRKIMATGTLMLIS